MSTNSLISKNIRDCQPLHFRGFKFCLRVPLFFMLSKNQYFRKKFHQSPLYDWSKRMLFPKIMCASCKIVSENLIRSSRSPYLKKFFINLPQQVFA